MEELKSSDRVIHFPIVEGIKVSSIRTGPAFQHHMTIMLPIDDKIEKKIDNKKTFNIQWNGHDYLVKPKNVFAYGEINLEDEDDIDIIYKCNIAIPDDGIWVYSDYDYKTNTSKYRDGKLLQYTSYDNLKIFKQCYGMLGCPKSILLFKVYAPYIVRQTRRTI